MPDSSNRLLKINRVSRSFESGDEEKIVLSDVSFDLTTRDSLAIIGPSGCGKTTLLLMINGLLPPTGGSISMFDTRVTGPRKDMALVLQDYGLFPWKTVRQNMELGVKLRKAGIKSTNFDDLETELGITGLGKLYPQQISGGQRQRVALARAFALNPELLLLDEPFAALDAMTRERLQQALLDLFHHHSFSFIIVTHNIEEAAMLGKRVMIMGHSTDDSIHILDNPAFGRPDPRQSEEFFSVCRGLRRIVEELS